MPQSSHKINLPWAEEHEAFCYQHHIPPAAKILWQWLMRQGEISTEIEPDLSEFNTWVAKVRGKEYAHNYLKQMFEILVSCRVLQVIKRYSWKISKLLVRLLAWLNPPIKRQEKNLQNNHITYNSDDSNHTPVEQGYNSSSNSSTPTTAEFEELERQHDILTACAEYQIYFDPKKPSTRQLFEYDIEEVRFALKHFVKRGGHQKVRDAPAWLVDCLRNYYWQDKTFGLSEFLISLASWFPTNLPRDY